ncbi:acyltransferase [Nocardia sp. 348MFTsu5.1]|uniref:acyltransferase n=1 Tax=Nocardia sp. 348MFTsu5.1 TaxID=1172185 RepID=UPI000369A513|nr:acyltransferase [Nocardia sp. 348MFTsu5.1]
MPTQLIKPLDVQRLDVRCNVGDAIVANLAIHLVFFFKRHLDVTALGDAFAQALTNLPVFAGRMAFAGGTMRIRCEGQGVPFTSVSSGRTLADAIRSATDEGGLWLIDPVNGATARWGRGPLCKVRVTHLADDATAIGFSWHHAIGDMQTFMVFMNAWTAAAAGEPLAEPLIVEDRAAYLDGHLPADGAREPGVRTLGLAELARSALYLAKDARKQRTLSLYFGEDEIIRMREAYGNGKRLSANDVVCAHISEALMEADPAVDRRTLAIAVNARTRCGLDPLLIGNILTTLSLELRRGEAASSIAERLRHIVDHFADEHCDMRINQQFLDAAGPWRAARCVSTAFDPARWNPLVSNQSGFGVYRLQFEGTFPFYYTALLKLPVAGLGALLDGADGRGLVFQMALPPKEIEATSSPATREHMHRFRREGDDIPLLHREIHG